MKHLSAFILTILALANLAKAGVVVLGDLARSASAQPGDSFAGTILVKNTGTLPADATVSQTDYHFNADGTNNYGEPGKAARSNANWITVTPARLKLAAGETIPVRYKGTVPADRPLSGTYWSMIMVEPSSAPPITPEGKADQVAVGLQTAIRFAIQIVTEVGQSGTSSLRVLHKGLVRDEGGRSFHLDIGNDGDRLLIPAIKVELFNESGASVGSFDAGRARIYPGCSIRTKTDLTKIPIGKYAAMVLLDSGDAQVMGAQYELEIAPEQPAQRPSILAGKGNE